MPDARFEHFYDGGRLLGLAYMEHVFPDCVADALDALPADHFLRPVLEARVQENSDPHPLWVAALLYPSTATWNEPPPRPARWSKQVGFIPGDEQTPAAGIFFRDTCRAVPVDSSWDAQIADLIH